MSNNLNQENCKFGPVSASCIEPTDLVFIRDPKTYTVPNVDSLCMQLSELGFLPLVQSDSNNNWFTDVFREIDINRVILRTEPNDQSFFYSLIEFVRRSGINIRSKKISTFELSGGNFIHNVDSKQLLYASNHFDAFSRLPEWIRELNIKALWLEGWTVNSVDTSGFQGLSLAKRADLDLVASIFTGYDNTLHAITYDAFAPQLERFGISIHTIPYHEGFPGGTNIADLRRGQVLIAPNRKDAPESFRILNQYAKAQIIEGPEGFKNNGGGLRCSISSVSI